MSGAPRDMMVTLALVGAFAVLVASHVATLFGLARRRHLREAVGALLLPPLAPYWAFTTGMRARAITWLSSAALYVAALLMAR